MPTMTLEEKMKKLLVQQIKNRAVNSSEEREQEQDPQQNMKAKEKRNWDIIESGIENVYLLRNRYFEDYFFDDLNQDKKQVVVKGNSTNSNINNTNRKRPEHWPISWTTKAVIWNSVGTLWADQRNYNDVYLNDNGSSITLRDDDDHESLLLSDPLLSLQQQQQQNDNEDDNGIAEEEKQCQQENHEAIMTTGENTDVYNDNNISFVDDCIAMIRDDVFWDYLVIYFSPSQSEEDNQGGGGFFDGVCTVSFRQPLVDDDNYHNTTMLTPYLSIASLATEKTLSDEDNEKVTKSMISAVVNLGKAIVKDVKEYQHESHWHKGFRDTTIANDNDFLMVCIAFNALQPQEYPLNGIDGTTCTNTSNSTSGQLTTHYHPYSQIENITVSGSDHNNSNNVDDKATNTSATGCGLHDNDVDITVLITNGTSDTTSVSKEDDFLSFWQQRIGFQLATKDDTLIVLRKFKSPFTEDYCNYYNNYYSVVGEGNSNINIPTRMTDNTNISSNKTTGSDINKIMNSKKRKASDTSFISKGVINDTTTAAAAVTINKCENRYNREVDDDDDDESSSGSDTSSSDKSNTSYDETENIKFKSRSKKNDVLAHRKKENEDKPIIMAEDISLQLKDFENRFLLLVIK